MEIEYEEKDPPRVEATATTLGVVLFCLTLLGVVGMLCWTAVQLWG